MSLSDVTVSDMSRDIVAQSLRAGLIEVGVTFEPYVSRLQKMRIARPVAGLEEVDNWSLQFLVLREDALPGNGKAVETLISGYVRAVNWWMNNPEEAVQFLSANNPQGVSEKTINRVMKKVRFLTRTKRGFISAPSRKWTTPWMSISRNMRIFSSRNSDMRLLFPRLMSLTGAMPAKCTIAQRTQTPPMEQGLSHGHGKIFT